MRRISLVIFNIIFVFLGCSHSTPEMAGARRCCATFAEMPFVPLPPDSRQAVKVNSKSPTYPFSSGRSFFAPFSLTPRAGMMLLFRGKAQGWTSVSQTTFCPRLLFLTQSLDSIVAMDVPIEYVAPRGTTNGYFLGVVAIPDSAAYMIVYDARSLLHDRIPFLAYGPLSRHPTEPSTMPCGPNGDFALTLQP